MKKFFSFALLLTVLAMGFAMTSCGDDDDDNNSSSEYSSLIVGTWTVTMDDPTWKCIVTFSTNGSFTSKEYYDEDGDKTFSGYEGTYTGSYAISGTNIAISPKGDSVMDFQGSIRSLTANSGVFADSDGWCMYLSK